MILRFRTKPNTYGNSYYLYFNTEEKIFSRNGSSWHNGEQCYITRKDMKMLQQQLIEAGYIETEQWM